ncbi:hypothetical protein RR51_17875 [Pseudomonas sp. C5pp]|uniref:Uncharacterized protein n=1 Tax=Pseudomonas taiwanensis SJ9 TaxID=1388762 RepID=V7DBF8_9PSED|nr:hypothetical protein O164_10925 [Pseudomonas taiwanensis SJ9]KIC81204.1 hypothetical protein RR51_17875 [Pseudomonas sp. C5pp]
MNVVAICFFFLGIVALLVQIYIAIRYLDEIEGLLWKSDFVSGNRKLYLHAGILGKIMRICTISTLLSTPYLFARKGLVDEAQLQNFPARMKRLLIVTWCTMCISSVAFLALGSF